MFNPDLRDARALPVLIVAGSDGASDGQAAAELEDDLADGLVELTQSSELAGDGEVADYGVADHESRAAQLQHRPRAGPLYLIAPFVQRMAIGDLDRPTTANASGRSRTFNSSTGVTPSNTRSWDSRVTGGVPR